MQHTTQDFLGRTLSEGDFVVYSVSYGSSPALSLARIGRIEPRADSYTTALPPDELPNDRVRMIVYVYSTGWGRADREHYRASYNVDKRIYLRSAARCVKVDPPEWVAPFHAEHGVPGA